MRDNHRDDYEKFFEQFGRGLKFGIYQSYGMQKGLLGDLLLFYSAKQQKMVTFEEYTAAIAYRPEGDLLRRGRFDRPFGEAACGEFGARPRLRRAAVHAGR